MESGRSSFTALPTAARSSSVDAETSESSRDGFFDLAILIDKLNPVLTDLHHNKTLAASPQIHQALKSLDNDLSRARVVLTSGLRDSSVERHVEELTRDLGRSLGLVMVTLAGVDLSEVVQRIGELHKEMMSAGASPGLTRESDFVTDQSVVAGEIEEESVEIDIEDVVLQVKNGGDDDEVMLALWGLNDLIRDKIVGHEWIQEENVVAILLNRLSSAKSSNVRLTVIKTLRNVVAECHDHKEKMMDVGSLGTLVKSLGRETGERREVAGLLLMLADVPTGRRRIGRVQGCIVMLVSMVNGDDHVASGYSLNLLNALSSDTQNTLHMAEAGYFKPLVQHLRDGSDMSKILMATALSRIELTDQNRAALGEDGAIEPLVNMLNTGKMEAKLSALNALHNLSSLTENIQRLIGSGIVAPLLQLLFSVTSVLMTLREPAAAILARIAQSESLIVNQDVTQQMLSLLSLSSPSIKYHLLQALNSICTHTSASRVRRKLTQSGAFQLVLPFLSEPNNNIRASAVNLLCTLSKYFSSGLTEQLHGTYLNNIVEIIYTSVLEEEKAAAVGILSNLPVYDKRVTDAIVKANLLPTLVTMLDTSMAFSTPVKCWLSESISRFFVRFTLPSDTKLQRISAQHDMIPVLVKLLSSESSIISKCSAATSLAQLSQSSLSLRKPKKSRWACGPPSTDSFCQVHDGRCHVKTTFCLVKAKAIDPLLRLLESQEREADEAVLTVISTLLVDEICENGSNCLVEASGVQAIIGVLETGKVKVQEKCLWILERVFRVEAHRKHYGEVAEGVLVGLAQKGDAKLKPAIAKVLAQLELLPVQSSYF